MSSRVIPKEELTAYQRWELAVFEEQQGKGGKRQPIGVKSEDLDQSSLALPTAEELERLHQTAWQEGHDLGYKDGFQEGRANGYKEGRQAGDADARRLAELVESLDGERLRQDAQLAEEILALALQVAKQVVRTAVQVKPGLVLEVIREALAGLPTLSGHLRIVVHPDDADTVRDWLTREHGHLTSRVVEDPRVERGGFRFDGGHSELDGSLPTRWREVVDVLGADSAWLE